MENLAKHRDIQSLYKNISEEKKFMVYMGSIVKRFSCGYRNKNWVTGFKRARTNICKQKHVGRPKSVIPREIVNIVKHMVMEGHRLTEDNSAEFI